jgi:hypothetical protein
MSRVKCSSTIGFVTFCVQVAPLLPLSAMPMMTVSGKFRPPSAGFYVGTIVGVELPKRYSPIG